MGPVPGAQPAADSGIMQPCHGEGRMQSGRSIRQFLNPTNHDHQVVLCHTARVCTCIVNAHGAQHVVGKSMLACYSPCASPATAVWQLASMLRQSYRARRGACGPMHEYSSRWCRREELSTGATRAM